MRRTNNFVKPVGTVECVLTTGEVIRVPVVPGIFKHTSLQSLAEILTRPVVLRKYTREVLRKAPWIVIREFPEKWLRECLEDADIPEARQRAIEFLLQ